MPLATGLTVRLVGAPTPSVTVAVAGVALPSDAVTVITIGLPVGLGATDILYRSKSTRLLGWFAVQVAKEDTFAV